MRAKDAKLFSDGLIEIMASRPDVLDSVTGYFKNRDQTRREAIKDIGNFSNDTYRGVIELMRKNADVKGFVLEIVKLADRFDFLEETTLFMIDESLKQGHTKEIIEILDEYFENTVFFKITQIDNENNNENNGH